MKFYVQNRSKPSRGILHRYHLTRGSTLTSQDYSPSSDSGLCTRTKYESEPIRAIIGCYDFVLIEYLNFPALFDD